MIVTIDGPAGTGKSTAARGLAARLGFLYLDTGAMYRAVALRCLERGYDPHDPAAAGEVARSTRITYAGERTFADGEEVTGRLRTPEVTQAASLVAQHPPVRTALVSQQRQLAAGRDIVCEGRDQGTVVFPLAECKFFLTADPVERAQRRQQEFAAQGRAVPLEELLSQQTSRDDRDAQRALAPLKAADDALTIDTTPLAPEAVLDLLEQHVRARMPR